MTKHREGSLTHKISLLKKDDELIITCESRDKKMKAIHSIASTNGFKLKTEMVYLTYDNPLRAKYAVSIRRLK